MRLHPRLVRVLVLLATVTALVAAAAAAAASIEVDDRFGVRGRVTTDFAGRDDGARAIAVDSKGRTVVAGWAIIEGEETLAMSRYLRNGKLDGSFGADGRVLTRLEGEDQAYTSVTVDSRDRVLAGGYVGQLGGDETDGSNMVVARHREDGTLDGSFGDEGIQSVGISGIDLLGGMALDRRGGIVAAGSTQSDRAYADTRMVAFRLSRSGELDRSFGKKGFAFPIANRNEKVESYAHEVQIDGRNGIFLAGGTLSDYKSHLAVVRLKENGDVDRSFGKGGARIFFRRGPGGVAYGAAPAPHGGIVVTGCTGKGNYASGAEGAFVVVRLSRNGRTVGSFGRNGIATYRQGGGRQCGRSIVRVGGGFVVGGRSEVIGRDDFTLFSISGGGRLDRRVGAEGFVTTSVGDRDSLLYELVRDGNRLVAAGYADQEATRSDFGIVRYLLGR